MQPGLSVRPHDDRIGGDPPPPWSDGFGDPQIYPSNHPRHAGGGRQLPGLVKPGGVRIGGCVKQAQFSEYPNLPHGEAVLLAQ